MPLPPFIVNLAPTPDELTTGLTAPIRFSVRDTDTFVVPDLIRVTIGYAQTRASGTQPFEEVMARTVRSSVLFGAVDPQTPPTILEVVDGIEITKTIAGLQRSVYFTSVDSSSGFRSAMAMAVVKPVTITNGEPGAVFGMENGPRRTGAYLFFERDAGTPRLRFCGPANNLDIRVPNQVLAVDWTGTDHYFIVWNEVRGKVELYRIHLGVTSLLHEEDISSFQVFDPIPGGTPQRGGASDIVLVYGIEGQVGEKVVIGNVALTTDVGFPLFGLIRTGEYLTARRSDETVRFTGGDPIKVPISSWFGPDDRFFSNPDNGVTKVLPTGTFRMSKGVSGDSMAIYREEPGFLTSDVNGFMMEAIFFGTATQLISARITGMGFFIFDGQTVFYLGLLSGPTRTVGLLRAGGDAAVPASFITPDEDIDWSTVTSLRLVVDPRREVIDLYGEDIATPLMTLDFDRGDFPAAADFGLGGEPAFLAFGHISDIATLGLFDLSRLTYGATYQAYESSDDALPDDAATDPIWTATSGGFSGGVPNPLFTLALLGGGFGILPIGLFIEDIAPPSHSSMVEGQLVTDTDPGTTQTFRRLIPISPERGTVVEFRVQITRHKPRARSGFFVIIDDGLKAYAVSFIDTEIGKFIAIPIRSGSGLIEVVGTEGQAAKLSAKIDWDQPHIYRLERRPLDGTYLFIDNNPTPALYVPDSDRLDYPNSQFITPSVAFGHIGFEGSRSVVDFVRVMYSEGYEISTKKVDTTAQLEEDIRNTQAMVIAFVKDADP